MGHLSGLAELRVCQDSGAGNSHHRSGEIEEGGMDSQTFQREAKSWSHHHGLKKGVETRDQRDAAMRLKGKEEEWSRWWVLGSHPWS